MKLLDEALDKITIEMLEGLDYGDLVELNERYELYHYYNEEHVTIRDNELDSDYIVVQWDVESDEIVFTNIYE